MHFETVSVLNVTGNRTVSSVTFVQCSGTESIVNFSEHAVSFYVVIFVIGLLGAIMTCAGNGLFVVAMIWHARKLNLPQKLLLTLATTNLLQGVSLWPLVTTFHFHKMQGTLKCMLLKYIRSFGYDFVMMTVFAILTITIEQFIAVAYPFAYERFVTLRKAIVFFTCLSLVHGLFNYLANFPLASKTNWAVYQVSVAICFLGLALVICACQTRVICTASAKVKAMSNPSTKEKRALLSRVKAARIALFILSGFLVAYIPFSVHAGYIFVVKSGTLFSRTYIQTTVELFALCNSAINPVIYFWRLHCARTAVKKLLGMKRWEIADKESQGTKSSSLQVSLKLSQKQAVAC